MKDEVILDSSVWIEIERKSTIIINKVLPYLDQNRVILIDVIATEVLRGIKSKKDFIRLQRAFSDFIQDRKAHV